MMVNAKEFRSANDNILESGRRIICASVDFRYARAQREFCTALRRFTEFQAYSQRRNWRHSQMLVVFCRNIRSDIATLLLRSADHCTFSIFLGS